MDQYHGFTGYIRAAAFNQPECHCPTSHGHPLSLTEVDHAMSSNRVALLALDWVLQFPFSLATAKQAASQVLSSSIGFAKRENKT